MANDSLHRPRGTQMASQGAARAAATARASARTVQRRRLAVRKRASEPMSQNHLAYERIREAVITLTLSPGEVLNAGRLAEAMRLGVTPINRALQRLMSEGLIRIIPRKGVAV